MKKLFTFAGAAFFALSLFSLTPISFATSGACSGHGGVSCASGPDSDGSVICNDGWRNSSVSYSSMVMCGGGSSYTVPTITIPSIPSIPSCSEYGDNATYDTLKDACKCDYGYVITEDDLGNQTCKSGDTVCREDYGMYTSFNSLNNRCECDYGYALDDNDQCIKIEEITPDTQETPSTNSTNSFSDVSSAYKYEQAVEYMKDNSIVEGYSDGTFKPFNKINRAEFTKILMEYKFGNDPMTGRDCFTDVHSEWYAPYVCLAKTKGIISGYPDGTFHPDQNITVPEALKIVLLADGAPVQEMNGEWYQKYLNYADSRRLRPDEWSSMDYSITRGEMAEVVWRLKN